MSEQTKEVNSELREEYAQMRATSQRIAEIIIELNQQVQAWAAKGNWVNAACAAL